MTQILTLYGFLLLPVVVAVVVKRAIGCSNPGIHMLTLFGLINDEAEDRSSTVCVCVAVANDLSTLVILLTILL